MKKSLFIIIIFISFCFINCGDSNSPSALEGVNVNMNDGSTIDVNNVDKLIVGSWECREFNANDGLGWIDIDETGSYFDIDFYADGSADVYYFDEFFISTWSSSGNTVTLSIMGVPSTITNINSSTFLLVMADGVQQIDFRFEKL